VKLFLPLSGRFIVDKNTSIICSKNAAEAAKNLIFEGC
jgi:hypothetical protein